MSDEEQPINFHLNVNVHKHDNRSVGMQVQHAERIEHRSEALNVSEATSSMRDIEITQSIPLSSRDGSSSAGNLLKKVKLRDVFTSQEGNTAAKSYTLMTEGKHDDAFEVMNRLLAVGSIRLYGEQLVRFYECLLRTKRPEQANTTRLQLLSLIKENIETTPHEIKKFADELREKSKNFDSILFYYVSGALYRDATEPNLAVKQIAICAYGMQQSIEAMLEADESLKSMVKHHVIPLITELKTMILTIDGASEQARCLQSSYCDYRKGVCEHLVDDHEAAEQTILDAVKSMQDCFGEKAKEYQLFGILHNNLGVTYGRTSRYREAAEYFELAINSLKLATDYQSSDKKTQHIKFSENNLRDVNEELNK